MRFSIRINNDLTVAETVRLARAAEAAGFDQFWISNDLYFRSAATMLAAVATQTDRIELGSCIFNPYTIHPSELAMLAATMDELTGNRFNLGLAAGAADFLKWVGLKHDRPVRAMRETILAIRALLKGERVPFEGHFLKWTDESYLRFQAPRVTPIYIGAMGPAMLRLTGELADGGLPLLFPPEHYETVRPLIARGESRRPAELHAPDIAACIWISLAEDREQARRVLAEKIAYYGPALGELILSRLGVTLAEFAPIELAMQKEGDTEKAIELITDQMLKIGVVGEPDDLLPRLKGLQAAGASHLSFGPPLGPDPVAAVELLGQSVLPAFR